MLWKVWAQRAELGRELLLGPDRGALTDMQTHSPDAQTTHRAMPVHTGTLVHTLVTQTLIHGTLPDTAHHCLDSTCLWRPLSTSTFPGDC